MDTGQGVDNGGQRQAQAPSFLQEAFGDILGEILFTCGFKLVFVGFEWRVLARTHLLPVVDEEFLQGEGRFGKTLITALSTSEETL